MPIDTGAPFSVQDIDTITGLEDITCLGLDIKRVYGKRGLQGLWDYLMDRPLEKAATYSSAMGVPDKIVTRSAAGVEYDPPENLHPGGWPR